jgi:hypothetical protein
LEFIEQAAAWTSLKSPMTSKPIAEFGSAMSFGFIKIL